MGWWHSRVTASWECDRDLESLHGEDLEKCLEHKLSVSSDGTGFILIATFTVFLAQQHPDTPLPSPTTGLGLMSHIYLPRRCHAPWVMGEVDPNIHTRGGRTSSAPELEDQGYLIAVTSVSPQPRYTQRCPWGLMEPILPMWL